MNNATTITNVMGGIIRYIIASTIHLHLTNSRDKLIMQYNITTFMIGGLEWSK